MDDISSRQLKFSFLLLGIGIAHYVNRFFLEPKFYIREYLSEANIIQSANGDGDGSIKTMPSVAKSRVRFVHRDALSAI